MPALSSPAPRAPVDRCPGALRPHPALDGPLVRLRLPGGQVSAGALRVLAGAAADLGDGWLELTSRGNVQLRALTGPGSVDMVAQRCADAGLLPSESHERVRNILGSPLSGRDRAGALDVRPLLARLDAGLCADPVLAGLPGRFAFALDDGRGDVLGLGADVAWQAGPNRLLLAGRDCGLNVPDPVPAMLAAARAFLDLGGGADGIWRLADLPDGAERIAATVFGATPVPAAVAQPAPPPVGPHRTAGSVCVVLGVPLGRLSAAQALLLAEAADAADAAGSVDAAGSAGGGAVVTVWRRVVVDLPVDGVDRWVRTLVDAGLVADPASPWLGLSACVGVAGCERALADVQADARAYAAGPAADRTVHWAGCERQCGRPAGPALVLIATGDGYRRSRGNDR